MIPSYNLMGANSIDPLWIGSNKNVCFLICSDSSFWCFYRKINNIANYKDPFASLLMIRSLKETHDFFRYAEMSMTKHFGGSSDMKVNFIKIFRFFSSSKSNSICLTFSDSLFQKLFLHLDLNIKKDI